MRLKYLNFSYIIFLIFFTCKNTSNEEHVLSDIIDTIIEEDYIYENFDKYLESQNLITELNTSEFDSLKQKYYLEREPKENQIIFISAKLESIGKKELLELTELKNLDAVYSFDKNIIHNIDIGKIISKNYKVLRPTIDIDFKSNIGFLEFSNFFFNSDKNRCFIKYRFLCGEQCGEENYLYLKEENGKWVVEDKEIIMHY